MGRVSRYPEEFRARAASLVLDGGRSMHEVSRELGISRETLRGWVTKARRERATGPAELSSEDRVELARLRRVT